SQTSASQAGLLLGSNDGIPAFRWYEKENRRLMVSNHGKDAEEIERRLSTGNGLLADGGASIDNMFSGDAPITRLTMSKVGTDADKAGRTRSIYYFLLDPYSLGRMLVRTIGEALKEYFQAWQQVRRDVVPRQHRGGSYPWLRAATNVSLRDLNYALVSEQMLRGTPSIYVDFLDYDEIAHHSGPERIEALHALEGIDRTLGRLERLAEDCPRPYKIVVVSDHGQSLGATFRQRYGQTVEELIRERIKASTVKDATEPTEQWGRLSTVLTEVSATDGAASRATRRMLADQTTDGVVELGPMAEEREAEGTTDALPDLVVCASGNLGLVFFGLGEGRLTLEQMEGAYPGLVNFLAGHPGIGMILVRTEAEGSVVLGPAGSYHLRDGKVVGESPLEPYGPLAAKHLERLDGIDHVGDLALISTVDASTEEVAAFEELIGSHGGLGGWQTRASLLYPADWPEPDEPLLGAPAVHRQLKAWLQAVQGTKAPS
ncbi:MAG TPA: alkaline phosphatase family protein, partial [Candidatus Limnocylindria bacterium]